MRRLVLYSIMNPNANLQNMNKINNYLLKMINKENPKVGYIASETDRERIYFNKTKEYYELLGINDLEYIDLGYEYDENKVKDLLKYDAIYLSTGNTFTFLSLLKKRNMLEPLRDYSNRGGILIGASAGSIMMCSDISIAQFADPNYVGITDFNSLGLVDFEIKPHWDLWEDEIEAFKRYSIKKGRKIYGVRDGEAIIVEDDKVSIYGEVTVIDNGEVYKEK